MAEGRPPPDDNDDDDNNIFLKQWNLHLPANKQLNKTVLAPLAAVTSAAAPPLTRNPATDDKLVGSLKDSTWLGANAASERLARKSTATTKRTPALNATWKDHSTKDGEAYETKKQRYKKRPNAAVAAAAPNAAAAAATPQSAAAKGAPLEVVNAPLVAPTQIVTLEQHRTRNAQTNLFALNIERPVRSATTAMIIDTPPPVAALSYCALLPSSEVPWYEVTMNAIAARPNMSFPKTPLMRRSVLMTFLRAPDPNMPYERPCFNLDRAPYAYEEGMRMRCVAHRMSAEQLGDKNAFRCRELLYNGQMVKINAALATRGAEDPRNHLHDIPELCYMCHIWLTTEAALDQCNRPSARSADDMLIVFNKFMVLADQVGEYHRNATLCSADVSIGIWGFFPRWNERNYRAGKLSCGLPGFEENEEMVFREARKSSQGAPSMRSGHTAVTPTAPFSSHQ